MIKKYKSKKSEEKTITQREKITVTNDKTKINNIRKPRTKSLYIFKEQQINTKKYLVNLQKLRKLNENY